MKRSLSLAIRKFQARGNAQKEREKLEHFIKTLNVQCPLPSAKIQAKKIALIRLDDIGDYILFRNQLPQYQRYGLELKAELILVGNEMWRSIYEAFDLGICNQCFWINKKDYHANEAYAQSIHNQLKQEGIDTVILASRSKPLHLDLPIAMAIRAQQYLSTENVLSDPQLSQYSNRLFANLLPSVSHDVHELLYNQDLAKTITGYSEPLQISVKSQDLQPQSVVLFIGASAKSKQWPIAYWIQLAKHLKEKGSQVILLGGPQDKDHAVQILAEVEVGDYVGKMSLPDSIKLIADAHQLVTGDSMAAHIGAACGVPTIILANGVNAYRFVNYQAIGFDHVQTIYTRPYIKAGKPQIFQAVSADMSSISVDEVIARII